MIFDIEQFREDILTKRVIKDKLTLRQVSDKTKVSPATISRIERSHMPDTETFCKLCLWLGNPPGKYILIGVKK